MARNVAIGIQQFDTLIEKNCFMWIKRILSVSGGKVMTA